MKQNLQVFKYFWIAIRHYKLALFVAFVGFLSASVLAQSLLPLAYREIIDAITGSAARAELADDLLRLFLVIVGVIIVHITLFRISDFANMRFQSRSMRDLYNFAFRQIDVHSYTFFTNTFTGSLVAKVRRFVNAFERIFDLLLYNFGNVAVNLVSILVVLAFVAPKIALLFFVFIVVYTTGTYYRVRYQVSLDLAEAEADSNTTGTLADIISNIITVKFFATENRERKNIKDVTHEEERRRWLAWRHQLLTFTFQAVFLGLLEIGSVGLALWLWVNGEISTGTIVLVQTYTVVIFGMMFGLGRAFARFAKSMSEAREMVEVFERPQDIKDPEKPEVSIISRGAIDFDNVTFKYATEGHEVFSKFDLSIQPGERIGLVGHSGAGKSTVTKLLLRFADVVDGAITIDGQDIRAVTQADLRAAIAYVPQEPVLFHRSLRENIAYARPDATEEEIVDASKKAHAHEFISQLPHEYDTLVGERGVKLSGGERQRVAIARAMLKDAPILLLDEATSSLDSISEAYIQESLGELMKGKTTIVIAHRLSTVKKMDRIVVLEGGAIVEEGSHDELLKNGGVYASLWEQQVGGNLPE